MWRIKSVYAKNFMSFNEVNYDFKDQCYIVRAENRDNEGQQSNGGGKTSLVDIVPIALLGESLTGRSLKDCINWNGELDYFEIEVKLIHWNEEYDIHSADPSECTIKRKIYTKKSGELIITLNDQVPKTLPTKAGVVNGVDVKEGNRYILEEILDITKQDLLNYYLISKQNYNPFLEVNTDKKLEVIGRFTNTKAVDKSIKHIEIELQESNDGIIEYDSKINQAKGYIAALEDSLNQDLEKQFVEEKENNIKLLEENIAKTEQELVELDDKINEWKDKSLALGEMQPIDRAEKESLTEAIDKMKLENSGYASQHLELSKDITQIRNYLAGLITCPQCFHKFHLRETSDFTEDDLDVLLEEADKIKSYKEANIELIGSAEEKVTEINENEHKNKMLLRERENIEENIRSIERLQERLLGELDEYAEQIVKIEAKSFNNERYNIRAQITEKELEITALTAQREGLVKSIDEMNTWVNHFEDFKFYLGNKPTELICSLVNEYLKLNGSDLNLHIEGFKKLKSGEFRQALNPVIYRSWVNPQALHQFSEGERVRLNVSTDLAFQQLINSASKLGGLDYYQNDEMISGLDSLGVKNAAEAFNQLGKTIILVTHSGADIVYNNTVVIEKENSISKIK